MITNILNINQENYGSHGVDTADTIYQQLEQHGFKTCCWDRRTITIVNSALVDIRKVEEILSGGIYRSWKPCVASQRNEQNDIQISLQAIHDIHNLPLSSSDSEPFWEKSGIRKSSKTTQKSTKRTPDKSIRQHGAESLLQKVVRSVSKDSNRMNELDQKFKNCSIKNCSIQDTQQRTESSTAED